MTGESIAMQKVYQLPIYSAFEPYTSAIDSSDIQWDAKDARRQIHQYLKILKCDFCDVYTTKSVVTLFEAVCSVRPESVNIIGVLKEMKRRMYAYNGNDVSKECIIKEPHSLLLSVKSYLTPADFKAIKRLISALKRREPRWTDEYNQLRRSVDLLKLYPWEELRREASIEQADEIIRQVERVQALINKSVVRLAYRFKPELMKVLHRKMCGTKLDLQKLKLLENYFDEVERSFEQNEAFARKIKHSPLQVFIHLPNVFDDADLKIVQMMKKLLSLYTIMGEIPIETEESIGFEFFYSLRLVDFNSSKRLVLEYYLKDPEKDTVVWEIQCFINEISHGLSRYFPLEKVRDLHESVCHIHATPETALEINHFIRESRAMWQNDPLFRSRVLRDPMYLVRHKPDWINRSCGEHLDRRSRELWPLLARVDGLVVLTVAFLLYLCNWIVNVHAEPWGAIFISWQVCFGVPLVLCLVLSKYFGCELYFNHIRNAFKHAYLRLARFRR